MSISTRDTRCLWHPYTQQQTAPLPIPIVRGKGAYLWDDTGKRYLDMISSWWVNLHGHSHPALAEALYTQAKTLEHVMFAGFTDEPAVALSENLLKLLPAHFSRIFYSDDGSTAVEIALKMAFQYFRNLGESRNQFVAFQNAYHGDTCGAMAVSKGSGFFEGYQDILFQAATVPYPDTWINDPEVENKEAQALAVLKIHLEQYGHETAAIIIEPLVQGAGGMRMCRPEFLQALQLLSKEYGVLVIYDEVMTGFGRTGEWFACLRAKTQPDIICLAKGLTGGFLPLAVTACHEKIFAAFLGNDFSKALVHGHTFTANPLGCSVALASLALLCSEETRHQLSMIAAVHQDAIAELSETGLIQHPRIIGTISAFEMNMLNNYGSETSRRLFYTFLERGIVLRPIGNVLYLMPPYCVDRAMLQMTYRTIAEVLQ